MEKSKLNKKEAAERIALAQETRAMADENFKLVSNQFHQGLVTNTEFLDAEAQLTKSKIEEWRAIIDYRIAEADYERALGVWRFSADK